MESYNVFVEKSVSRKEITDFLVGLFESNNRNARRAFDIMFDYEPNLSAENFIIARSFQGALIGLVRIVDRQLRIAGALLNVGGISSVSVLSEWSKKGVRSLFMKKAHVFMKERGKNPAFNQWFEKCLLIPLNPDIPLKSFKDPISQVGAI